MTSHFEVARRLSARYAALGAVEAVAIAGSLMHGVADKTSDVDLYVYTRADLTPAQRAAIVSPETDPASIDNSFWGPGDEWIDTATKLHVDVMFFSAAWIEDQLNRSLVRYEASTGYSTCFWHTIRVSQLLFDRTDWFEALRERADVPYPAPLVRAIVAMNEPILRRTSSSYLNQIKKAITRGDLVSVNHRVAAFLASYFDVLFALNRVTHPGEKRLLDFAEMNCNRLPRDLRANVEGLIQTSGQLERHALPMHSPDGSIIHPGSPVLAHVNLLVDGLDELLRVEGLI